MRIIQLIDSLEAGGAERMAVNYANALGDKIDFSGLVVSRKEGLLLNQIKNIESYLFLDRKRSTDIKALLKLRRFVKQNKIEIVHAHSTSFFLAFLLKLSYPRIQLIWHDHYGDSEFLSKRPTTALKFCIPFYNGIVVVNQKLKVWAEEKMLFKNVIYLPNFPSKEIEVNEQTILSGIQGKRIVLLANLRVQKNHFLLLEVAKKVKISHPDWSLHLIGKDFEDDYSEQVKSMILEYNLEKSVFIYGSKQDINTVLKQSTIAVLTSQSEGLPVALLEYGLHQMPVVVTNVGEIPMLIQDGVNGFLVASGQVQSFYNALIRLIENDSIRDDLGKALYKTIYSNYSEEKAVILYLEWLKKGSNK
jgi:glycosyltransferase involved in cell wall biosynthesis